MEESELGAMPYSIYKILLVVSIQIAIALIHVFRLGQVFSGQIYRLYYGYASDILLPFGAYFLLTINDAKIPLLRHSIMLRFGRSHMQFFVSERTL